MTDPIREALEKRGLLKRALRKDVTVDRVLSWGETTMAAKEAMREWLKAKKEIG